MTCLGYPSYQDYREETNVRTPKTEEKHREKLVKKLDTLYKQKDYRALELITKLADELLQEENEDRALSVYSVTASLLRADERTMRICKAVLR